MSTFTFQDDDDNCDANDLENDGGCGNCDDRGNKCLNDHSKKSFSNLK